MGYSLIKYLDSSEYKRALFYLDRSETDLPIPDPNIMSPGSKAISQSTGQEWFLDSNRQWQLVRNCNLTKGEQQAIGGSQYQPSPKVSAVKVIPQKATVAPNSQIKFKSAVIGNDIIDDRVLWEIISGKGEGTFITPDGKLFIGNRNLLTNITIKASSYLDASVNTIIVITVDPDIETTNKITGINILPTNPSLTKGSSIKPIAEVFGVGEYDDSIEWTVNGTTDSVFNENGVLLVGANEESKTFVIEATSTEDPTITASMPILIVENPATITNFKITPEVLSVAPGVVLTFGSELTGTGDYIQDILWEVEATSPNTFITNKGVLVIGKDEIDGTILVKAVPINNPLLIKSASITVDSNIALKKNEIIQVIAQPQEYTIYKSYSAQFAAQVIGVNVTNPKVIWSIERNTSDYTTITSQGNLRVASEEGASAVIVRATSMEDPTKYDLVAVSIKDAPQQPSGTGSIAVQQASDTVAGIAKLYNTPGLNTDGAMTQKSVAEAIAERSRPLVDPETETLIFN